MQNFSLEITPPSKMYIILSMANLYRYDLSEFTHWNVEDDGMHRCYGLEIYWVNDNLPFLIYVEGELAGFVLIKKEENSYEIGEFFILRKFRRTGLATTVILELFKRYKGVWIIQQLPANKPALQFWEKILKEYTQNNFEEETLMDDEVGEMCVMKFSNKDN